MGAIFLVLGCSIFVLLGLGHTGLLLFTTKFEPRDATLLAALKASRTQFSNTGNLWRGMQGFHLSHSLGLVVFGGFYIALTLENVAYLRGSTVMTAGLLLVPLTYICLAHRFWFNVPRNCSALALGLLLASVLLR